MPTSKVIDQLIAISRLPSPGPSPAFSHVHICRALLNIGDEGPIGRIALSKKLGLGEGAIRTILKHLTQARLITTVKNGCILTRRGSLLHTQLRRKLSEIVPIDARQLSLDKVNAAILIRGASRFVKKGVEQRDAAIRVGATGACTLVVRRGEFLMPMSEQERWKLRREDELVQDLESRLHPKDRDVVTIISAVNKDLAEQGAMAAALTLLD